MIDTTAQSAPEGILAAADMTRSADRSTGDFFLARPGDAGLEFLLRAARRSHPDWWTPIDASREETSVFVG
ncbi:MAG: hypothetical protein FLDDKLPJ_02573 [Phycisphaerae bacterium]|nr:hypothetical protein [Phycisphaerae bacterium]